MAAAKSQSKSTPRSRQSGSSSRKKRSCAAVGVATVNSNFNNTIITIADLNGQVIAAASGGRTQKGARKATAHAATEAAKIVGKEVHDRGMSEIKVILKGTGAGRDAAVRAFHGVGLKILTIADRSPIPHGGVRKRKKKRV